MVAADFGSYVAAQERAAAAFRDQDRWLRMSIRNTAASGKFSTDRTMREYARDIWGWAPCPPYPWRRRAHGAALDFAASSGP